MIPWRSLVDKFEYEKGVGMKTKMIFDREDITNIMKTYMATKGYRVVDCALTKDDGQVVYSDIMEIMVTVEKMNEIEELVITSGDKVEFS